MHTDYTTLMSLALDGEATSTEMQRLREHLRTCAACTRVWERWQVVDRQLDAAPFVAPAFNLVDSVMARIEAHEIKRRRTRSFGAALLLSWLVVTVLVLGLCGTLVYWGTHNPQQASGAFFFLLKGVSGATWLSFSFLRLMGGVGAPTLAAVVGLLATLTCLLGMLWLWVVTRSHILLGEPVSVA